MDFSSSGTEHRMMYAYNPNIGHLYVPNQFIRVNNAEKAYFLRTNNCGFRSNKEFRFESSEKQRIVFLGDSHTAGDGGVNNEQRFSDKIETRYSNCSSYNFALAGSGIDQQVLIYEKIASKYEHDIICFSFHQKIDLSRLVPEMTFIDRNSGLKIKTKKPYFDIERMEFLNVPVPRESTYETCEFEWHSQTSKNNFVTYLKKLVFKYSPFGNNGKEFVRRSNYPLWIRESVENIRRLVFNRKYLNKNGYHWKATELLLNRLIEKASGRVVIICPLVDPTGGNPDLGRIYTNLTEENKNVIYINLQEKLKKLSRAERWAMYNKYTWHYNHKGHDFIAKCIVEEIDKRLVPPFVSKTNLKYE